MIEKSKYCSEVIKKHFIKELVITKEDNEALRTLINVGSVTMIMLIMMLKREIIFISLENIETLCIEIEYQSYIKSQIPVVFHNLKNYDSPLIIQELVKFNLKINEIPNGLGKCIIFTINNKLLKVSKF